MSFKIGSFISSLAKEAVTSSLQNAQNSKSSAHREADANALNSLSNKMPGAKGDANTLLSLKTRSVLINNLSDKASDPPEKTPRVLLDEILQKQPVTVKDENAAKVKTTMKADKSPDAMTGDDYRNAFRRAVYTQAMGGVKLSDAEIKMADKALVDGGHYKTYFNLQGSVDRLRASQKQSGSQMPVNIGKENIEYARRAGQAVLQSESAKAEKFDSNQAKARAETNRIFADQGKVLWNVGVNMVEGTMNTAIDGAQTKGGVNPLPLMNPYRPQVDLSSIKADYTSEMMRRDTNGVVDGDGIKQGKAIETGVTLIAPIVIGAAITPKVAPETIKSLGGIPEVKTVTPVGGRAIGEISRRDYDPEKIGIPIRNLSTDNIKITNRGIDFVEKHLSRFGSNKPNEIMVQRLRNIADGKIEATQQDLNFYSHELRESVRYKNLGFPEGQPKGNEARELWNNAHTPTLEEYKIRENNQSLTENPLYHPDATKFFFEDNK